MREILLPILLAFSFGDDAGDAEDAVAVDTGVFDFDTLAVVDEECFRPPVKSADFEECLVGLVSLREVLWVDG